MKCFVTTRSQNDGCNLIYVFGSGRFQPYRGAILRINEHCNSSRRRSSVAFVYTHTRTHPPATINRRSDGGDDESGGGGDLSAVRCSLYRVIFCKLLSFCSKIPPARIFKSASDSTCTHIHTTYVYLLCIV